MYERSKQHLRELGAWLLRLVALTALGWFGLDAFAWLSANVWWGFNVIGMVFGVGVMVVMVLDWWRLGKRSAELGDGRAEQESSRGRR